MATPGKPSVELGGWFRDFAGNRAGSEPLVAITLTLAEENHMRITAILLGMIFSLTGCSDDEVAQEQNDRIKAKPEDVAAIRQILEAEFEAQSTANSSGSIAESDLAKEAEEIFTAFWNPKNLKRYGKHEWDSELYANADYLITQSELLIARRKDQEWPFDDGHYGYRRAPDGAEWQIRTIRYFAPAIKIPETRIVHLTPSLTKSFHDFLGEDFTEAGIPDIMSPANAKGVSREKLAAAREVITIFSAHWGDGWHLASHPEVEQILVDENVARAVVAFRIAYQGGYAFMEKAEEGWRVTESRIDWIE